MPAWNPVSFVARPKNPADPTEDLEGFFMLNANFVKSFEGNKGHETHEEFSMQNFKFDDVSLKVRVDFLDGEVMYGMTHGYAPNRKGFFVFPADTHTNNQRVFVVREATASVKT